MYTKPSMKMKLLIMSISAIVLGALMIPTVSTAATTAEVIASIQSQIAALQAQLNTLLISNGTSENTAKCVFDRNLTVGASGADVVCLQNYLTGTGHFSFNGGSTGTFGPITRTAVSAWQTANGIVPAVGYFGPISIAKYNALGIVITPTLTPTTTPVTVNNAKLTSNNPASTPVTKNASNVKMLDVKFDGNGTVDSLSVKRIGFSSDGDFNGIYLYKDGVRLADKKYFGSNSTVTFTNLKLQAPFVLTVMTDFSANSGKIAKVELSGDYSGLPLTSNDFTIVDVDYPASIKIEKIGSLSEIVVGQQNALISEFRISNIFPFGGSATTTEAVSIKHLELYNTGHNVLSNIKLTDGTSNWVGSISGSKLIFDLDYFLKTGRSKTFKVYADVDGRVDNEIKLQIQNDYDIVAIGDWYKFGVKVDYSLFNKSVYDQDLSLRDIGKLSVQSKTTDNIIGYWGQSLTNVAKFRFTADDSEGFFIDDLKFATTTTKGIDKLSITYKTKDGSTITKTETVDSNEEVMFDSFSTSDRPYVAKDSDMDITIGVTLRNDEDSVRLYGEKTVKLYSYSVTGESSDEEILNATSTATMKNNITSRASTVSFSKNGTINLDPNVDIDFSVIFNSDNRDSAFEYGMGTTTAYFRLSTTTESRLNTVIATIKVGTSIVVTTTLTANGIDTPISFSLVESEEDDDLIFSDGDKVDINISFEGLDNFDSDEDILTVTFKNDYDTITWVDNYDSSDNASSELVGNVKDMTTGLPLKFNFKN